MFEKLKVSVDKTQEWDKYLGKFDVMRIVMTRFIKEDISVDEALINMQRLIVRDLKLDSGNGYADIVYLPSPSYHDKPVLLIELKRNKSCEGAIDKIKQQNYPERLEHYKGNILLIGINYNIDIPNNAPEFKCHACVIEKA